MLVRIYHSLIKNEASIALSPNSRVKNTIDLETEKMFKLKEVSEIEKKDEQDFQKKVLRNYSKASVWEKPETVSPVKFLSENLHSVFRFPMKKRRWKGRLKSGLSFSLSPEVDSAVREEVSAYLQRNAADKVENIYAQPMLNLLKDGETPERISDTKYFKLLHDVVRPEMVSGNPDVKSVARCEVCHYEALDGRFNRFAVRIPNYYKEGVWRKVRQQSEDKKVVQE